MSNLQTTMNAMYEALVDVPAAPTAWVPLRRATVLEAIRLLNGVETAVAALRLLEDEVVAEAPSAAAPAPTWRYPVLSAEEAAAQTVAPNGTITGKSSAHSALNGHSPAPVTNGDRPNNSWRRRPKEERLTILKETIVALATNGWLTQQEFDRRKPEWMPSGSTHVAAFGISWRDLVRSVLPGAVTIEEEDPAAPAAEPFRGTAAEG